MRIVYTIGHSNHDSSGFLNLLEMHGIKTVFDVRSQPYSRFNPQFRYKALSELLGSAGISYIFSGKSLGARPGDPGFYENGRPRFDLLAQRIDFRRELERVLEEASAVRCCLMCAEKEPLSCHRTLLVCRNLKNKDAEIYHILYDGSLESHSDTEKRMIRAHGLDEPRLFNSSYEDILETAYDLQIERIQRRS